MAERKLCNERFEAAAATIRLAGEQWSSTIVPRSQVPKFTGGLFSVGTMANADCDKNGPEGGFRVGRQWCYPVSGLVSWLIGKLEKEI